MLLFILLLSPFFANAQMNSASVGSSQRFVQQLPCQDLMSRKLAFGFPHWKIEERMMDLKMPSRIDPQFWVTKGAKGNRLNGKIPRVFYVAANGKDMRLWAGQGSYSPIPMFVPRLGDELPREGVELIDYFVDHNGRVLFGFVQNKNTGQYFLHTDELEAVEGFSREFIFKPEFKPHSTPTQFGDHDLLILGKGKSKGSIYTLLYQVDMTPRLDEHKIHVATLKKPSGQEGADYGRMNLIWETKTELHPSYDYQPDSRRLGVIENPGPNARVVIRAVKSDSSRKISIGSVKSEVSVPDADQVKLLPGRLVGAASSKNGGVSLIQGQKILFSAQNYVANPKLGADPFYFLESKKHFLYLERESTRTRVARYRLNTGKKDWLTSEEEDVVEFQMMSDGSIVFVSRDGNFGNRLSDESLRWTSANGMQTKIISTGKGPYSSRQFRKDIEALVERWSPGFAEKSKTLKEEVALSQGFQVSPNGTMIIYSEFFPDYRANDIFKNSSRVWRGMSPSTHSTSRKLVELHGFSWMYPSPDFYSAAVMTRAKRTSLKYPAGDNGIRRVMFESDHRVYYLGNPEAADHAMGGFEEDWKSLY